MTVKAEDVLSISTLFRVTCILLLSILVYFSKNTLESVQLMQFDQIKVNKDNERQDDDISDLKLNMKEIDVRLRARGINDVRGIAYVGGWLPRPQ